MFVRNYLHSGALDALDEFECLVISPSGAIRGIEDLRKDPRFRGTFEFSSSLKARHQEILDFLTCLYRRRSKSFAYRMLRPVYEMPVDAGIRDRIAFWARYALKILKANQFTGGLWIRKKAASIPVSESFRQLVSEIAPDMLIFPSSAFDPVGPDVVRIAKSLGIPSFFLVDNWDNLSSKSILWEKPDWTGVWAEQSRQHAIGIQGLSPERVRVIGTPRFESYYAPDSGPPFPGKYVLFVGFSVPFDELSALRALERALAARDSSKASVSIIYRPHPARQRRLTYDRFNEHDFKHVAMDPECASRYFGRSGASDLSDLRYYPKLLKHAEFVIGPPTTMLLEALICRKRVLLLSYDDKVHFTTPKRALERYTHFEGIRGLANITACDHLEALVEKFEQLLDATSASNVAPQDPYLKHFIYSDENSYSERLRNVVSAAFSSAPLH